MLASIMTRGSSYYKVYEYSLYLQVFSGTNNFFVRIISVICGLCYYNSISYS